MKEKVKLMSPKVDFVFKCIFGNPKAPEILISFLNAVFNLPEENKIIKVQIENPNIDKNDIDDKYSILDIKATANDDTKIDIEIQICNKYDMVERTLYYLSKLIEGQLNVKDRYKKLMKSVTINILDYKMLKENDRVHNSYVFKEKETNEVLTDLAEIHFIELAKLREKENIDTSNLLNEWLLFIENPEGDEIEMITKKIPEIKKAKEVLEWVSIDKKSKRTYESRQNALREKVSLLEGALEEGKEIGKQLGIKEGKEIGKRLGIKEGIKEGEKTKAIEMAKKMLKMGEDIEKIVIYTELTKEEIKKLK